MRLIALILPASVLAIIIPLLGETVHALNAARVAL